MYAPLSEGTTQRRRALAEAALGDAAAEWLAPRDLAGHWRSVAELEVDDATWQTLLGWRADHPDEAPLREQALAFFADADIALEWIDQPRLGPRSPREIWTQDRSPEAWISLSRAAWGVY